MNKMTYEQFKKQELERVCKKDWFDKNGNNVTATVNRSFIAEIRTQISAFNYDILHSLNLKVLAQQLINLIVIVSMPVTYIPFLMLRVVLTRRRAEKEMMDRYRDKSA